MVHVGNGRFYEKLLRKDQLILIHGIFLNVSESTWVSG